MLLAIDTATECCSVALGNASGWRERVVEDPRQHAARLLPMVDELLAEAGLALGQLDAIAFGRGPGSFTGLRIAVSMAQGLAFATDLPLLPVSTLAAVAQEAHSFAGDPVAAEADALCLASLDARMGEVYWGLFHFVDGLARPVAEERLSRPGDVQCPTGEVFGAGSGWSCEGMPRGLHSLPGCQPRARALIPLATTAWRAGEGVAAEQAMPVYLRNEVAWRTGS